MHEPKGVFADGADLALIQFEVVDANGQRCPPPTTQSRSPSKT